MTQKINKVEKIEISKPVKELEGLDLANVKSMSENKELIEELKQLKSKVEILESAASDDLRGFENNLKVIEAEQIRLSHEMESFPEAYKEVDRGHKSYINSRLSKFEFDLNCWSDEQKATREKYDANKLKITNLYKQLVAVTLIDDPSVVSDHLNCGVNGDMISLFYSGDSLLTADGDDSSERRVQLISYRHYVALMCHSYKVSFKTVFKNGRETQEPRKISPVVEAFLPDKPLIAKHHDLVRKQNKR